jgi:plastocyanin
MSLSMRSVAVLLLSGGLVACGGDPVSQPTSDELVLLPASGGGLGALNAQDEHGKRHIAILDDCDASDPAWGATGGCAIRGGAVREAEFGAFLVSPLALSVIGHPAWRNEPSYLRVRNGKDVRVTNDGGRSHTFTPVAQFGGGRVTQLNIGLEQAPECAPGAPNQNPLAPGERLVLDNLAPGNHRFQCCIHPWMRAQVKVQ